MRWLEFTLLDEVVHNGQNIMMEEWIREKKCVIMSKPATERSIPLQWDRGGKAALFSLPLCWGWWCLGVCRVGMSVCWVNKENPHYKSTTNLWSPLLQSLYSWDTIFRESIHLSCKKEVTILKSKKFEQTWRTFLHRFSPFWISRKKARDFRTYLAWLFLICEKRAGVCRLQPCRRFNWMFRLVGSLAGHWISNLFLFSTSRWNCRLSWP